MAKTLAQARKKPDNIGELITAPSPAQNVPTVVPRELPGLSPTALGPAPAVWTTGYDSVKQFYRPGTSQQRFPPLPTKANPQLNAQAASVATTIVNQAISSQTASSTVSEIFVNVQPGTSYTVLLSDRDTLISMTNNAGGTVTLPGTTAAFAAVQTVSGGGPGNSASAGLTNTFGNAMIVTSYSAGNGGAAAPTIGDTNGNAWILVSFHVSSGGQHISTWYATNIVGGLNSVQVVQPSSGPVIQFTTLVVTEFSGVLPGGIDQIGTGASGSASLTPTVKNTFAYFAARTVSTVSTQPSPQVGWTGLAWAAIQWATPPPPPAEYVNGLDQYLLNPPTAVALTGSSGSDAATIANFRMQPVAGAAFPKGWFTYIQNSGTGVFTIQSVAKIDGFARSIKLAPNTGVLIVSDGVGYWTDRGIGASLLLKTNGIINATQNILNLVPSSSVSIADDGLGNLTFSSGGGSGLLYTPPIYTSSDNNFANDSIFARMNGALLISYPTHWTFTMAAIGGTGVHIQKSVVLRTLRNSLAVVDSTTVLFSGAGSQTVSFGYTATAQKPGFIMSDPIALALDNTHDYYIVTYFDTDGGGLNAATVFPSSPDSYTAASGGIPQLIGGFVSGDQTGITTIPSFPLGDGGDGYLYVRGA